MNHFKHKDEVIYFVLQSKTVVNERLQNTYGIGAYSEGVVVDYISDLSFVFEKVKSLVDSCNKEELPLIYLHNVADIFKKAQHVFF